MMKWMLLLFFPIWGFTQNVKPFLTTYTSQHGIPPLKIIEIAKDSSGYLWLGSNIGLHRFDGKIFKTFSNLPSTIISDIQVNSAGKVFVAIADFGIGVYNEYTEELDFYKDSSLFENLERMDFRISFGKDDKVYIVLSGYGLLEFDQKTGKYKSLIKKLNFSNILALPSDSSRLIIAGDSIFMYDTYRDSLSLLAAYKPFDIVLDANENLWINESTFWGYMKINIASGEETLYEDKQESLTYALYYSNGEIWSDAKLEVVKFNTHSATWEYYQTGSSEISGFFADQNGSVWIGQDNKLNVIEPQNQFFKMIPGSEQFNYASSTQIGPEKFAFLSFSTAELHSYDLKSKKIEIEKKFNEKKQLILPFSMVQIKDELWVSFFNGIGRYRIGDGRFERVEFSKYNDFFENNNKLRLYKDSDDNLWMNLIGRPVLFRVNVKTLNIDSMHYKIEGQSYTDGLKVNSKGEVKLPSDKGIITIDLDSKQQNILPYYFNGEQLDIGFVDAFLENESKLWIVTSSATYIGEKKKDGIYIQEELKNGQVFNYSQNLDILNGLGDKKIILTSAGIKVIDEQVNQFNFWGLDEGLTNITQRTVIKQFEKYLFLMTKGIFYVDQTLLFAKKELPRIFISSLMVNEIKVNDHMLKPDQNDIKIKFESIDLTKPLDVQYKYRLSTDNPWIYEDYRGNEVYFLDLKPGEYRFEVCAKHKNTGWSEPVFREFEIKSPFWRKWWFISGMILLFTGIVYLYYRWQLRKVEEVSKLKTRMMELENEALRAQMNPHFIFNSLNSIKSYIIDHEKEDAADYLTNFSDLIRLILANSREQLIPLEKELSALRLYMDIENNRLDQKFTYNIINEKLDTYIQPLTLQPFIENAIWHGFIHKKGRGELLISIKKKNDQVIIEIVDDGVGRKKSQMIEKKHKRKRSFGILITKERLSRSEIDNNIKIEDLIDKDGNSKGTKVTIVIPYQNTKS